jgi:hypothetical protein
MSPTPADWTGVLVRIRRAEGGGQRDQLYQWREPGRVQDEQCRERAAADQPEQHQQVVVDIAEPVPGRQLTGQRGNRTGEERRVLPAS